MGWWGAPSFTAAVLRIQHVNVYHADVLCTKRRSRTVRKRTHPSQSFVVLPRPSPHPRLHPAASPAHPPNPQANHHIPMSDGCASSGGRGRPAAAGESATRRRDTPTQYSPRRAARMHCQGRSSEAVHRPSHQQFPHGRHHAVRGGGGVTSPIPAPDFNTNVFRTCASTDTARDAPAPTSVRHTTPGRRSGRHSVANGMRIGGVSAPHALATHHRVLAEEKPPTSLLRARPPHVACLFPACVRGLRF